MKQALSGLIVVVLFGVGAWMAFQIYSGRYNPFQRGPRGPEPGTVNIPVRLGAMDKAQMEVELSLVDAQFAAQKAGEARLPENRNIKIDR